MNAYEFMKDMHTATIYLRDNLAEKDKKIQAIKNARKERGPKSDRNLKNYKPV